MDALGAFADLLTPDARTVARLLLASDPLSDLVEITFQPEGRTAWVRAGATLVEAGEAAGVEIVMGCTRGMCGTDPVRIASGADGLSVPEPHETGTIERMGLGP
ncbi:MAG: 2Fe-2S iron-sulfur cluster-binding protein, partial [Planctomycetota bacterium]